MAKKLYALTVKGRQHTWSFNVRIDPQFVEEWRADGLEIDEVCNTIPVWVADLGMVRVWCFLQDCFYFKYPFKR